MPLLLYGRLGEGPRKLYASSLREIEVSTFDKWKIKHLSPHGEGMRYVANFWWFEASKHCAVSWNEGRTDIDQPVGIVANESEKLREQSIFIPALLSPMDALSVIRTEFPRELVPSPLVFRFNNQDEVYLYD